MGLVLSSFFYGYIFTQIPGGWLAAKVGGAKVFGMGVATTALLTLVTPPFTKHSFYVLLAIRIIEGFFEVSTLNFLMFPINHYQVKGLNNYFFFPYARELHFLAFTPFGQNGHHH